MITWDEPKRLANLEKHGFDFSDLPLEFFATALIRAARDKRMMAIGPFGQRTISVVYFRLGSQGISLISMRRASVKERKLLRWQSAN